MADIRIVPGSSIMSFTSSLNFTEKITQDPSGSLNLYGSGSTGRTELFSIDGNNGRLFTVSDDLSDSLFSVNTIAGLPVIEAFANNTVVMGQYGTNALVVSGSKVGIGTTSPSEKLDVNGYVKATGFKTPSGTATQFLMADGSTNSNTYAKTDGTGASGTWGINISGNASKLNPLSGDSNYKLAYTADGARTNAGEWGRAVMYYVPNGQTYGIRVDRADYADNAGSVGGYTASSLWRSDGGTWTQNASITLNQTANDQEWSFDMYRNGYIGGYWHVWDSTNGSILRARADTGRVSAPYSFDTPIFYDSNNTGYYVDPASTTVLSTLNVNNYLDLSSHLYTRANIYNLNSAGNGWNLVVDRNGGNHNIYGATFYDSNNTAFYVDPASTSNLNGLNVGSLATGNTFQVGTTVTTSSALGMYLSPGDTNYWIGKRAGAWTQPLDVSFYTGIRYHSHYAYGGHRFFVGGYDSNEQFSVGNGDNHTRVYGNLYAPIIYDINNTGYYVDPASTSVLNALTVGGSSVVTNNGGTWGISISGNANTANTATNASYLTPNYVGGQQLNPQTYFNYNVGVKVAMTAAAGVWSDTLWINGYNGGDVLSMCALHFQRNGTPRMYISTQNSTATSYGTLYEVLSNYGGTGTYSTTGDFRAPIFYDSNNTAFYIDPSSTSNVYRMNFTGPSKFVTNYGGYCGSLSDPSLQVYSDSNNSAFFSFHKGGQYAINMGLDADNVLRIGGWSASANRFQMDMSGNLTMAGDITAYSDRRVKENIKTIDNALEKVNALRGVYYNRTDSEDKRTKVGVIAQEVLEVVPEVVNQDNDGMYNVSYGNMVGLLIEAIKEQQKQIDELKELIKNK